MRSIANTLWIPLDPKWQRPSKTYHFKFRQRNSDPRIRKNWTFGEDQRLIHKEYRRVGNSTRGRNGIFDVTDLFTSIPVTKAVFAIKAN